jgi:Uncharacterized conserved protein
VETVKGYAKHEREVFENVTKARSALMTAETPKEKAQADNMLTGALKSLFAVAEAYPQLQASQNFQELQRQLEDTGTELEFVIMVIAVSCVKLLSAHNSTQHTSRKHKV